MTHGFRKRQRAIIERPGADVVLRARA